MAMTMSIVDHELPDDTHNVYDVKFFDKSISTIVTNTPSFVDSWIAEIERIHRRRLHCLIVGLDVEWRPNQSRNSVNPVATLQLCVGRRCLVFQILHSPTVPESLNNFLRNPNYTFAGVEIESDVEKLTMDYKLVVANMADVRLLAAEKYGVTELQKAGIKSLALRVLGKEISKPKDVTLSRWDDQWLSPAQVQYACIDAFLSFEIGRILTSENQNRLNIAISDCYKGPNCRFIDRVDPPLCTRCMDVIPGLLRSKNEVEKSNKELEALNKELEENNRELEASMKGYKKKVDPPPCTRCMDVIPGLLRSKNEVEKSNKEVEKSNKELEENNIELEALNTELEENNIELEALNKELEENNVEFEASMKGYKKKVLILKTLLFLTWMYFVFIY